MSVSLITHAFETGLTFEKSPQRARSLTISCATKDIKIVENEKTNFENVCVLKRRRHY